MPCILSTTLFAHSVGWQDVRASVAREFVSEKGQVSDALAPSLADKVSQRGSMALSADEPQQQPTTVRGRVTDRKTGEGLSGTNVMIRELTLGAASDPSGAYSFVVPEEKAKGQVELTATMIGYKAKTVGITLKPGVVTVNIELDEDVFQLEAVVVTGIASKTAKGVAQVAASRIQVSDVTKIQNFQGLTQLVSGKIAGVTVGQSSGNVGTGMNFFVRGGGGINGTAQPIIYVDGVRVENFNYTSFFTGGQRTNSLAGLNPNDIENIEILKGPAAASTYGTNASNGVVLITTKSGKLLGPGKGYTVNYEYNFGLNTPRFDFPSDFLNADTMNGILNTNGMIREHSVSVTGGANVLRYFASYSNRYDAGLIPAQNYIDRNSLKASFDAIPSDQFSLKFNTSYTWYKLSRPFGDDAVYGYGLNALCYYPAFANCSREALAVLNAISAQNALVSSASVTWRPLSNLELNAGGGAQYSLYDETVLYPYGYKYGSITTGWKQMEKRESLQKTYDLNARYSFKDVLMDRSEFSAVVGTQIVDRKTTWFGIDVRNFGNEVMDIIGSATDVYSKWDTRTNRREAGIYADLPFSYDGTYFWTIGVRKDYSSAIGAKSPAITYPHASAAVRLDKLSILPSEIGMLKLRASYGESGQLPNVDDGVPLTYGSYPGGSGLNGLSFSGLGNPAIEPERIKEYELGFDTEFLNMFSLEFTLYLQNATRSIVNATYAPSTGLGDYTFPYNVGSVENKGIEALLQVNPIRTANYDLSMSFIWNYQKNEVKSLGFIELLNMGRMSVMKPGLPKWEFYEYQVRGATFNADGTYKGVYVDSSIGVTGKMGPQMVPLGNPFPDHSGSITLNFRFLKNFNLYAMGEWGLNNVVLSYSIRRSCLARSWAPYLVLEAKLGKIPSGGIRPVQQGIQPLTPGTPEYVKAANEFAQLNPSYYGAFVYDADFFYFREVSLSYDFTNLLADFVPRGYISGMQAGISVRNVAKWTKYPLDPEANYRSTIENTGTEWATLPQPRTYNFWIKMAF